MRKNLLKMFAYLRPELGSVAVGLVALAICDGLQFVIPQVIRHAVDELAGGTATTAMLAKSGAAIVGVMIVIGVFRFLWRHFIVIASHRIDRKLRDDLYVTLQRLPQDFYHRASTGDLMARATNDIRQVQMACGIGVVILADTFFMGVTAVVFMLMINPALTAFSVVPLSAVLAMVLALDPTIRRRFETVQERFSDLTERIRENISGIRVVKAFVQEGEEISSYRRLSRTYVHESMRLVRVWGALFPAIMLFTGVSAALTMLFGGRMVIEGKISVGDFVAFMAFLGMLTWPMMAIGWVISMFQRGSVSMGRLAEVLESEPVKDQPVNPAGETATPSGSLDFRDLTFSYPGCAAPALSGVSFALKPGGSLGIVGRIGSGKSTVISLAARLEDPPPGTVFVDGMDVTMIPLSELRRRMSWVPQESFLFSDTLAGNIAFSRPAANAAEIEAAASTAGLLDSIRSFPEGFETRVGERGVTLSGGERQRACIARALLSGAPLLLLDDCLSAVDARTERGILGNLRSRESGRTVVVVSHRISAVEWCDEILVLKDGRVVERGDHAALAAGTGLYADMHRRQQLDMRMEAMSKGGGA